MEYSKNIIEISPYSIPDKNHHKLFSILKPLTSTPLAITSIQPLKLPVYKSINFKDILESNNQKFIKTSSISSTSKNHEDIVVEEEVENLIDISQFLPKNLKDQVTTIIIENFPNIKRIAIEKILKILVGNDFKWTMLDYEFIETKLILIRFKTVEGLKEFMDHHELNNETFKDVRIRFDPTSLIVGSSKSSTKSSTKSSSTISSISLILEQNHEKKSAKTGTEDLDKVLNYYNKYKIDANELIDVPSHMKDLIIQEIIKFRSKVLIIERDNRRKEIERERIIRKNKLQKIFEGIKEVKNVNEDEVVDEEEEDELDDLDEEEYLEYLDMEESNRLEKIYTEKLNSMKSLETIEKNLRDKLAALKRDEDSLLDNKLNYIEDIKNEEKFATETSPSTQAHSYHDTHSMHIQTLARSYYKNHSQYLKVRNQKRTAEELQDAKDVEDELNERKENEKAINFLSNFKKQKKEEVNDVVVEEGEESDDKSTTNFSYSDLSSDLRDKLGKKIIDLVEEYLGIKDDFLLDVINESIATNNLNGKKELVEDLTEVLDEDSVNLVEDLWKFIQNDLK